MAFISKVCWTLSFLIFMVFTQTIEASSTDICQIGCYNQGILRRKHVSVFSSCFCQCPANFAGNRCQFRKVRLASAGSKARVSRSIPSSAVLRFRRWRETVRKWSCVRIVRQFSRVVCFFTVGSERSEIGRQISRKLRTDEKRERKKERGWTMFEVTVPVVSNHVSCTNGKYMNLWFSHTSSIHASQWLFYFFFNNFVRPHINLFRRELHNA